MSGTVRVLGALLIIVSILPGTAAAARTPPPLPADFQWGVATSGYQAEGHAPDSNWRRYVERRTAAIKEPYRNGVDFRHRYPEDIALAAAMGVKVFRFGVEWARVQPRRGQWDRAELGYYDDVLRRIRTAGLTPMITLSHFVHPGWIVDQGGWDRPRTVQDWLTFAQVIVERYRGLGASWITFNEPTLYIDHETRNRPMTKAQSSLMKGHLVDAHREAYDLIHRLDPGARVSSNTAYIPVIQGLVDGVFMDRVADKLDFVGIDYYYGLSLDNLSAVHGAAGEFWKIKPQPGGIYHALRYYHRKLPRLPLYIVENGMPTDDGKARPDGYTRSDHLRDHVYWLQRARADGVDVIGYLYWSLTDNYEWGSYRPRFGLYTVDARGDRRLTRRPTDAVRTYRTVVSAGGVPPGYAPVAKPSFCSIVDFPRSCLGPNR